MTWKNILRKSIETATRSAELWAMNDYDLYQDVKAKITTLVKSGHDKEEIITILSSWLPNMMAHMDGFMEELEREDAQGVPDAISDVDWEEVSRNYEEDIDTIIEDYA